MALPSGEIDRGAQVEPGTLAVHLDCDLGIDDALALGQLLSQPHVDLVGVSTVSGNTSAEQAARNTLGLLDLAGRGEIPVAVGEQNPAGDRFTARAAEVHGRNGIGDVDLPPPHAVPSPLSGAELILESASRHDGELRLVAIGPLTNLARALELDPELPGRIARLTIMGGAVWCPGNITEAAEANIFYDPEAADAVFAANWPITLVPLDVTRHHTFGEEDRAALEAVGRPLHGFLARMMDHYLSFYSTVLGSRRARLHDPLTTLIATGGITAVSVRRTPIRVDTGTGPERGRTIPGASGRAEVEVLLATDVAAAPVLLRQLASWDHRS